MLFITRRVRLSKTSSARNFIKLHEVSICLLTISSKIVFSHISVHRPRAAAYLPEAIDRAA
jgi:hypothetical protein